MQDLLGCDTFTLQVPPGGEHSALMQVSNTVDTHQTEGLSTQEPGGIFTYPEFDGILGLAYPSLASKYLVPMINNIVHRHLVATCSWLHGQDQGSCTSGFQGDDNSQKWILGDVFIQECYSIFDRANNCVRLGKAV
ncbi:hypothetical protein HPG69_000982 [Diceros bicornis minor]|uniref:Peptidase A1 domain-containing protein n=1 Tax=Diceros bicornis minor TaxID=77932 RepID=A0A7J7E5L1_DICBM|nr:hypothetical protein HPG69_000982 [Diceros bicornis minor]